MLNHGYTNTSALRAHTGLLSWEAESEMDSDVSGSSEA